MRVRGSGREENTVKIVLGRKQRRREERKKERSRREREMEWEMNEVRCEC